MDILKYEMTSPINTHTIQLFTTYNFSLLAFKFETQSRKHGYFKIGEEDTV